MAWIQEQGIGTREELERRYHVAEEQETALQNRTAELNTEVREINEQIWLLPFQQDGLQAVP